MRDFMLKYNKIWGLDFVTKQHKTSQKLQPAYSLVYVKC